MDAAEALTRSIVGHIIQQCWVKLLQLPCVPVVGNHLAPILARDIAEDG